ncbi:hypothetical protein L0337_13280 [candidate division KSB1 bacterium]|nr:hypothetical protein [candidate division KSB1 bacterium]
MSTRQNSKQWFLARIELGALATLAIAVVFDLAHFIFNSAVLEAFGFLPSLLYFPSTTILFVKGLNRVSHLQDALIHGRLWSMLLLVALVLEVTYCLSYTPHMNSSLYYPLIPELPDSYAGLINAAFCLLAVLPLGKEHARFRIFTFVVMFAWLTFTCSMELIMHSEGYARGVDPLWGVPIVGKFVESACGYMLVLGVLGALPLWALKVWGHDIGPSSGFDPVLSCLVLLSLLLFWLLFDRTLLIRSRHTLQVLAVNCAAAVLYGLMPMWMGFYAD